MFRINDDNSIYVTRGDMVFLKVTAQNDGEAYTFQPGEVLRIKIYGKKDCENVVLQKDFPVGVVTQEVDIVLEEKDTKIGGVINKPTDYWYEVELNPFDNPQTIIGYDEDGAKLFRLYPEGGDGKNADDGISVIDEGGTAIYGIDDELDMGSRRPVQNQVIARAFAALEEGYRATHEAVTALHVTPQMFGAVGDGKTDDTAAFRAALATGACVYVPSGEYSVSGKLTVTEGQTFEGTNSSSIHFTKGSGVILNGRNITMRNLILHSKDGTGVGVTFEGGNTSHYVHLEHIKITGFDKGLTNNTLMWNNTFIGIRCTSCDIAFDFRLIGNIGNFCLTFINCYSNQCGTAIKCASLNAEFIGCNFGIIDKSNAFNIGNSVITFSHCNFECDEQVTTASVFLCSGISLDFRGCKFLVNMTPNARFFSFYSGMKAATFENCAYLAASENEATEDCFFNKDQFNASPLGIRFVGGCSTMPRPKPHSNQIINFADVESGTPVAFYETMPLDALKPGVILYEQKNKVLCWYNGTNIVSCADNTVIV